jgi:hypothetical protein
MWQLIAELLISPQSVTVKENMTRKKIKDNEKCKAGRHLQGIMHEKWKGVEDIWPYYKNM